MGIGWVRNSDGDAVNLDAATTLTTFAVSGQWGINTNLGTLDTYYATRVEAQEAIVNCTNARSFGEIDG